MGKHEVIGSAARVAKHRAAMRAKGFRLKQIWVPDMRDPTMQERLQEESRIIGAREEELSVQRWIEAVSAGVWDEEPEY